MCFGSFEKSKKSKIKIKSNRTEKNQERNFLPLISPSIFWIDILADTSSEGENCFAVELYIAVEKSLYKPYGGCKMFCSKYSESEIFCRNVSLTNQALIILLYELMSPSSPINL